MTFDEISDWLIAEIASWILAQPLNYYHRRAPYMSDIKYLIRFSMTCKRVFCVINRSENAQVIWSPLDIGTLIPWNNKDIETQTTTKLLCSLNIIRHCHVLSMIKGLTNAHILELTNLMQNIRELEIELPPVFSMIPRIDVDYRDIFRSIESLKKLRYLTITGAWSCKYELVPMKFPSTLCKLVLGNFDVSKLIGKSLETFESITSLTLSECSGDMCRAIASFPAITSLSMWHYDGHHTREEFQKIWKSCTRLEEINVSGETCHLYLEDGVLKNLKRLMLDIRETDERLWDIVSRNCLNLVELCIRNPEPTFTDISSLKSLKKLQVLKISLFGHVHGRISTAFGELGKSDGVPFTTLVLEGVKSNLQEFFSSRRCSRLRHINFMYCSFKDTRFNTFVDNIRDSIKHVELLSCKGEFVFPLFELQEKMR